MPGKNNYGKAEDAIAEFLNGETRENALNFTAYMNKNGLTPVPLPYEIDGGRLIVKATEHIKKLIEYAEKSTPYAQRYHPNFL